VLNRTVAQMIYVESIKPHLHFIEKGETINSLLNSIYFFTLNAI